MKSLGAIFTILMLFMSVMVAMQIVGEESYDNSRISSQSKALITNYSSNINNNLNFDNDYNITESNLTENATYDSEDVFAQEYLEGKSGSDSRGGVVKNIVKVPDLILLAIGLPESSVVWVKSLIALLLTVILSFAAYRAIFGGGRVTDN